MPKKRAFTLVEVLTVLAIIGILSSMIFPSFSRAREGARRASCSSNLRQIGMAITLYTEDYDERYPLMGNWMPLEAPLPVPDGCPAIIQTPVTWAFPLQPYTRSTALFVCPSIDEPAEKPSESIPIIPLHDECIDTGNGGSGGGGNAPKCPPAPRSPVPQPSYAFNTMMNHASAWQHTQPPRIGQGFGQSHVIETDCPVPPSPKGSTVAYISHGLGVHSAAVARPSETILMADAASREDKAPQKVNFTNDLEMDYPTLPPTNSETLEAAVFLAKRHLGGYNALFADGHTKFLRYGSSQPNQWTIEED